MKFISKYKLLIAILIIGFLLRVYKFDLLFQHSHDQDLLGWFIRDVLENRHIRLVGQETSSKGIFIGPLFYYLLIPFYFLAGMDPIGGIWFSVLIGLASIASFYFVFSRIFNKQVGLICAFVYAVSFNIIFTDRDVVPTTPVMLWTVWYFYSLFLLLKGNQKYGFLIAGVLFGLIWHLNLALMLVVPLVFFAFILSKKRIEIKSLLLGVILMFLLILPLIIFETRHNFQQITAVIDSLTTDKGHVEGTGTGLAKLDRTFQIIFKNTTNLLFEFVDRINYKITFFALILGFVFLIKRKIMPKSLAFMAIIWQAGFILFFTLNPINISEYYLNGMNVIWILIFSLCLWYIYAKLKLKFIFFVILGFFTTLHIYKVLTIPVDASGYVQKKALINFIKEDSLSNNYPCVSISYITSPGRDLGYRYLIWYEKMHVNQPKSGSPVYSIVFPHSKVDRIDKSFGALGLVLPDYKIYNKQGIEESCSGQNSNITDPMFGFTY